MTTSEKNKSRSFRWLADHRVAAREKYELLFGRTYTGNTSIEELSKFLDKPENHWVLDNMIENTFTQLSDWYSFIWREVRKFDPNKKLVDIKTHNAYTGSGYVYLSMWKDYHPMSWRPAFSIRISNHSNRNWKDDDTTAVIDTDDTVEKNKEKILKLIKNVEAEALKPKESIKPTLELFNVKKDIALTNRDAAWVYLAWKYDYEMEIKSWKGDDRMGVKIEDVVIRLKDVGAAQESNGKYVFDERACDAILDKHFGSDTLQGAFDISYGLIEFDTKGKFGNGYTISSIPLEYYLHKHPSLDGDMEKVSDLMTEWHNYWMPKTMNKILRLKHIKEINKINAYRSYFPNTVPTDMVIYRGIKAKHNSLVEKDSPFSSWTTDLKQAERFSKYHFTTHSWEAPQEAKHQTILEVHVKIDDIAFFYGGSESEVIMKNPVNGFKVHKYTKNAKGH